MPEPKAPPMRSPAMPDPAPGASALLVIDMLNRLAFSGGDAMLPRALAAAGAIARLRDEADAAGMPVIYVNDNHGDWTSDRADLIEKLREDGCKGRPLVDRLEPRSHHYFLIKPQFSGFYATSLPALLPRLGVSRLILTGIAADICILFTAADAHMREYPLWVPHDAVASENEERTHMALEIMDADTRPTTERTLTDWLAAA